MLRKGKLQLPYTPTAKDTKGQPGRAEELGHEALCLQPKTTAAQVRHEQEKIN